MAIPAKVIKTAKNGGSRVYIATNNAGALGTVKYDYTNVEKLTPSGRPETGDMAVQFTSHDTTIAHESFLGSNYVKVTASEALQATFNDGATVSVSSPPTGVTPFIAISLGGVVSSDGKRRCRLLHSFISELTESDEANEAFQTYDVKLLSTPTTGTVTVGATAFNALFSDYGTLDSDLVLATGDSGRIFYI